MLNDRVTGNWGAGFPTSKGTVIGLCFFRGMLIKWDDAYPCEESWHIPRDPASSSPIGVTVDD